MTQASAPLTEDALYQFRFRLPGIDGADIEVGAHLLWLDRAMEGHQANIVASDTRRP